MAQRRFADPYLELYNANSALIAIDDDAGPAFDSMLRFTATQSGTYYINARAWEPDTGPDPISYRRLSDQPSISACRKIR